jgi:predicted AlkP superfamily pyrophosphatase or phosphodiesterase
VSSCITAAPRAAALAFALLLPAAAGETAAVDTRTSAKHVVLVSIDGLRPEFYRDPQYPLPLLQRWASEGAQAEEAVGIFPSVTYPSHTTIITGALSARHGIFYNSPFEPEGQSGRWYWEASSIKARTLWDACREAGKKSAAVSWPVTVGAPIDLNVPEAWPLDWKKQDVHDVIGPAITPPGLLEELEREVTGKASKLTFSLDWSSRDIRSAQIAAHLLERHRPALLAVHLLAVDHHCHEHGRDHPRVRQALALVDVALGLIEEAADRAGILEDTAFVVTGDHGFVNTHMQLAPNVWLIEHGLRGAGKDRGAGWRATFHASGGGAFLMLARPDDQEAVAQVRALLAGLPASVRAGFRVLERAELDAYGVDPAVPLALAGEDGWGFTSADTGAAVRPSAGGTHGFLPELPRMQTGLVAWGSGVRGGAIARRVRLTDVAPLVMRLLEVPFEAPDGLLPMGFVRSPKK